LLLLLVFVIALRDTHLLLFSNLACVTQKLIAITVKVQKMGFSTIMTIIELSVVLAQWDPILFNFTEVASLISRDILKFIYSEKATNFCKISNVDLSYVVTVKSTMKISQNFVAFSEYMNVIDLQFGSIKSVAFEIHCI
jgi:hypothetical protein